MTPQVLTDLEKACFPLGVHPFTWLMLLIVGLGVAGFVLFQLSRNRLCPIYLVGGLSLFLMLPLLALVTYQKDHEDMELLVSLLKNPQGLTLKITKSTQETYTLEKKPVILTYNISNFPIPTIIPARQEQTPYTIPNKFLKVIKQHNTLIVSP